MDKTETAILEILPPALRQAAKDELEKGGVEEVRLRCGVPATLHRGGRETALFCRGRPVAPTPDMLQEIVEAATEHSAHTAQAAVSRGYVPLRGGGRLGLCGRTAVEGGRIRTIYPVSSLNLRIARQRPGCADALLEHFEQDGGSLLILGPPGRGKTTLLRDAVRLLSDRLDARVGLADARGEIAAVWNGVPQLNVGRRTDVLTDCPAALAIPMLVRTMNPQWVCLDELTDPEELQAMERASYCGVRFLATAHAAGVEDLKNRPLYRRLLELRIFDRAAVLRPDRTVALEPLEGR